jgi:transposase
MSLPASPCDSIPEQTIQVACAAFPKGNPSMRMRDALGTIYTKQTFAALFSHTGRPAEAPAQLALMSVMQCAEGLSDAQAADAVRARNEASPQQAAGYQNPKPATLKTAPSGWLADGVSYTFFRCLAA